jgi:DNA-binding HxlR family transcriptional regulator/putative sterol carrier protein
MKLKSSDQRRRARQPPRRRYGQLCAVARALDYVGERWTLLLIRELMIGPRRFKDILEGLPGIGTNLLANRLRELAQAGIVARRVLPPPAGSTVYELTEVGRGLEPVVFALGKWGHQFLRQAVPGEVCKPGWFMVALRATFRPDAALDLAARYDLRVDGEMFVVDIKNGRAQLEPGPATNADLTLTTDLRTLVGLVSGEHTPTAAIRSGKAIIDGDRQALQRFVRLFDWGARVETPANDRRGSADRPRHASLATTQRQE